MEDLGSITKKMMDAKVESNFCCYWYNMFAFHDRTNRWNFKYIIRMDSLE